MENFNIDSVFEKMKQDKNFKAQMAKHLHIEEERAEKKIFRQCRLGLTYHWPEELTQGQWPWHKDISVPYQMSNDDSNAYRLVLNVGKNLMFIHELGWHHWEDGRWTRVPDEDIVLVAHGLEKWVEKEIRALDEHGQEWYSDQEVSIVRDDLIELRKRINKHATMSQAITHAKGMLIRRLDQLNTQPMLFSCRSGTIELGTGILRAHDKHDFLTKQSKASFHALSENLEVWDATAVCPEWVKFLETTFCGDTKMIEFVQRVFGYCLTGDNSEQKMFIFWGKGKNGKSTMLNTIRSIMGEYADVSSGNLIIKSIMKDELRALAPLPGKRLIVSSELGDKDKLDVNLIKKITGGEDLKAKMLYKEEFSFKPECKIIAITNNEPEIDDMDDAIIRRLVKIPFTHIVSQEERDPLLETKLLMEADGILQWMVVGAMMWRKHGLGECDIVTEATAEYVRSSDTFGSWLEECVDILPGFSERSSKLYANYVKWCQDNRCDIKSHKQWGRELNKRNFYNGHDRRGSFWPNFKLKTDDVT